MRNRPAPAVGLALLIGLAGCAETLPEEDLRIYAATPASKLSADILWKDYQTDPAAADRQYWGQALEVSGNITAISSEPPHAVLTFGAGEQPGVRATLLDEEAAEIVAAVKVGDRITLKCFCEGLDGAVRLKSCINPRLLALGSEHESRGPSDKGQAPTREPRAESQAPRRTPGRTEVQPGVQLYRDRP